MFFCDYKHRETGKSVVMSEDFSEFTHTPKIFQC